MATILLNVATARATSAETAAAELRGALQGLIDAWYDAPRRLFDYAGAVTSAEYRQLRDAVNELAGLELEDIGDTDARIAFWLNAYNALALHVALVDAVDGSVRAAEEFFTGPYYCIGSHEFTLDAIEHGILRANRPKYLAVRPVLARDDPRRACSLGEVEPLIHFGLYSATRSAPTLASYAPDSVREQLEDNAVAYLAETVEPDQRHGVLRVPRLFQWYRDDFGGDDRAIREFILARLEVIGSELPKREILEHLDLDWRDFDWSRNERNPAAAQPA